MEKGENYKKKDVLRNKNITRNKNSSKKKNMTRNRRQSKQRNKKKNQKTSKKGNILKKCISKIRRILQENTSKIQEENPKVNETKLSKGALKESKLKFKEKDSTEKGSKSSTRISIEDVSKGRKKTSTTNLEKNRKSYSKGKHTKKRKLKVNPKAVIIRIAVIMVIIIGIVIYNTNNKEEETPNPEIANEQVEETVQATSAEEEVIEETVDTSVEQLIAKICAENNLNENNFHFFYYNIEEKKYYFYNEDTYFTAASTIKVPVTMLYYDQIAEGKMTLEDELLYNIDDYEAGGGTTSAYYSPGECVPLSHLLEQTIVNSDNTALNILMGNLGYRQCKEELTKYSDIEMPEEFYTSNIASGAYYYDVLQYLYQNAEKYKELIEYMKISSGGEYLKANLPQYNVAHKYGSYSGYVHDYGIIYGENTYLIGVFTNGVANASQLIAEIGEQVVNCVETEEVEIVVETNTENDIEIHTDTNTSNDTSSTNTN